MLWRIAAREKACEARFVFGVSSKSIISTEPSLDFLNGVVSPLNVEFEAGEERFRLNCETAWLKTFAIKRY